MSNSLCFRKCFFYNHSTVYIFCTVQLLDSFFSFAIIRHFYKSKTFRTTCFTISNKFY